MPSLLKGKQIILLLRRQGCASSSPSLCSLRASKHTRASPAAAAQNPGSASLFAARAGAAAGNTHGTGPHRSRQHGDAPPLGSHAVPPRESAGPQSSNRALRRSPTAPTDRISAAPHSPPQPRGTMYAAPACDGTGSGRHAPLRPSGRPGPLRAPAPR